MRRHPEHDELMRLISGMLDGRLSPEDRARLEGWLASDGRARRLYMQMVDQEIELPCLLAGNPGPAIREPAAPLSGTLLDRGVNFFRRKWVFGAAAACVVVLGLWAARQWSDQRVIPKKPEMASTPAVTWPAQSWSEDFEDGEVAGWFGRIVDLPSETGKGITTAPRRFAGDGTTYQIVQLPEDWKRGLFELTNGSTLHITYRLGAPAELNVFMHTIPVQRTRDFDMFQLRSQAVGGRAGEWQTTSIPFSEFVRKIAVPPEGQMEFAGGPPEPGELVTTLSFSSPEEIDFVIDRLWITSSGAPK